MKLLSLCALVLAAGLPAFAAVEEPIDHRFKPAATDPVLGDWQGAGGYVAQIALDEHGDYQANVLTAFEADHNLVATLRGQAGKDPATLRGGGWSGRIEQGHFKGSKGAESFDLQRVVRASPTLGAKAPVGAVVLFDGRNLDAFANKKGKEWLVEDGPAPWKIVDGGILEVVPGTGGGIISRQKFGDCHLHVEFRTLGAPSNSGVFLQTRYEADISESYGRTEGSSCGNLGNCTPKGTLPRVRAGRAPLEWQTFDIDFTTPRFDAAGNKTAPARMTVVLNGSKIYDQQELNVPTGAAGRLGEAATGPLMLQEHGMPLQFRNIWLTQPAR
ncbi:MAG: hypothetical protein JWQ83_1028 [Lacunisphaera sp.]|jgi:hypothetical protein|nr:hypothetical protein [Lacunisphaera sp.]